MPGEAPAAAGGGVSVGDIVNVAKFGWDFIKDNAPTGDVTSATANGIPNGATLQDLDGWVIGQRRFEYTYNWPKLLTSGTTIVLALTWWFNGHYNGVGQYILNAKVDIVTRDIAVGGKVHGHIDWGTAGNVGTRANPIAALPFTITINEDATFQTMTKSWSGIIHGSGYGEHG